MEMNPIIGREVRSRWRHWHAFALTLLWAAALVVVVCQSYDSINPYHGTFLDDNAKDFASMSQMTGRELFKMLALVQAGAWLFLAPMLTATGIATERERGLLESLQLSPLTGGQIIRGKLFSALAFISLLMLAALPVMAICFLIGGVSPADLVVATLLQFTTAFCGASIGLFFSSRARRPLAALTQSLVFVALWSFIIYTIGENLYPNPAAPPWWITMIMVILTHPVAGLWAYTAPEGLLTQTLSIPPTSFLTTGFSLWSISFIFQFLLSSALLFAAARKVAKPFHASTPNDRHWSDAWKSRVKNQTERKTAQRETVKIGEKAQSALLCEPPSVDAVIRSNNPILQRQLRGAFRLSRGALWLGLLQAFILIGLSGMFVLAVIETFNKESRVPLFYNIAHSLLFLAVVAGALNGARGFTRERESGTWESISISLMTPRDIIFGKLSALFLTCLGYSLPALVVLLCCIRPVGERLVLASSQHEITSATINEATGVICLIASALWFSIALALLISSTSRTTVTATVKTLASLGVVFVGAPSVVSTSAHLIGSSPEVFLNGFFFGNSDAWQLNDFILNWWHPWFSLHSAKANWSALDFIGVPSIEYYSIVPYTPPVSSPMLMLPEAQDGHVLLQQSSKLAYINSVVLLLFGCLLLAILYERLKRVDEVRERRRITFRWK